LWPAISSAIVTLLILGFTQRSNFNSNDEQPPKSLVRTEIPSTGQQSLVNVAAPRSIARTGPIAIAQHAVTSQNVASQAIQEDMPHVSASDRLEMQQQMMVAHNQRLAVHDRESRDFNWASQMENRIQDAFRSLPAGTKARIERADCRSQTCAVEISWPSRDDAQQELQIPSIAVAQIPCNDGLVLPPSTAGEGRFQATMLLDCASHEVASRN